MFTETNINVSFNKLDDIINENGLLLNDIITYIHKGLYTSSFNYDLNDESLKYLYKYLSIIEFNLSLDYVYEIDADYGIIFVVDYTEVSESIENFAVANAIEIEYTDWRGGGIN